MTKHIMVDLETMGTGSFAPIIALGATWFDPNVFDKKVFSSFEARISLKSNAEVGLVPDASTIDWWMGNARDDARRALNQQEPKELPDVLEGFTQWVHDIAQDEATIVGSTPDVTVWGNGATFDNVILTNAYGRCGMERPWSYRGDCCFRTLRAMAPGVKTVEYGVGHRALHDAISQALTMKKIVKKLKLVIP